MKKRFFCVRNLVALFIGIFLLVCGNVIAQEPEGEAWLKELEAAIGPLSVNVETVDFAADSFFDVFVETVLEGQRSISAIPVLRTDTPFRPDNRIERSSDSF